MPIYAYKCSACQHGLEVLQKVSDAPLTLCPECGAPALVKQLTAAGFQLKGSGWYVTDFRDGGAKPEAKGDAAGAPDAKTPAAGEAKADAKPDAKVETKTEGKTEAKAETRPAAAGEAKPSAAAPGKGTPPTTASGT
jgi:putative FmdB family regulatory protein